MREASHALAEDVDLRLLARLGAGFGRRGGLRFEREVDVLRFQYLIGLLQERQYTSETEICDRLVDDFLDLDGADAGFERDRHHQLEVVETLTSDQRRQNGHGACGVVQIGVIRSRLVDDLVISEVREQLDEFRVCLCQRPVIVPELVHAAFQLIEHDISLRFDCDRRSL